MVIFHSYVSFITTLFQMIQLPVKMVSSGRQDAQRLDVGRGLLQIHRMFRTWSPWF